MTTGDLFVQMPPNAFDGIGMGGISRQEVEHEAVVPPVEILLHGLARRTAGIVTDDVNFPVPQQATSQVLQVAEKEGRAAAFLGQALREEQGPGAPVQGARQIPLLIRAGRQDSGLATSPHPHRPDLGIGIDIHLCLSGKRG